MEKREVKNFKETRNLMLEVAGKSDTYWQDYFEVAPLSAMELTDENGEVCETVASPQNLVEDLESRQQRMRLYKALATLTPREEWVLRYRMGLGFPESALEQIAQVDGCQRERIRQIEAKTLRKLRENHIERFINGEAVLPKRVASGAALNAVHIAGDSAQARNFNAVPFTPAQGTAASGTKGTLGHVDPTIAR